MRRMTRHALLRNLSLLGLMTFALAGCASSQSAVSEMPYAGWPQAYRLTNGTVEVVVVPAMGRIMRYGYIGGENLLWENPALAGRTTSTQPDEWANFGGDKIYEWSQDDWKTRFGRDWPPPPGTDPVAFHTQLLGDGTLRLTSDTIPSFGLRIIRDIRLSPTGTALTSTTTFEQVATPTGNWQIAPWENTQWRSPDSICAHLVGDKTIKPLFGTFPPVQHTAGDTITLDRPKNEAAKIGLDADTLGVTLGNIHVTERLVSASLGVWLPDARAQIFCDQDAPPRMPNRYIELEFTAPRKALAVGDTLRLQVEWYIDRVK